MEGKKSIQAREYKLELLEVVQETPDVRLFRFRMPDGFYFYPGQFVMLYFMDEPEINYGRAYSIASSPENNSCIEIGLTKVAKFTSRMFGLEKGAVMKMKGPYGKFYFSKDAKNNVVLIGGGTGITPLMSIIRQCSDLKLQNKISLVYSVKSPELIIYRKEIEEIKKINSRFDYDITVTREHTGWKGSKGRITAELLEKNIEDVSGSIYFLCGSNDFVKSIIGMLEILGVKKEQIKTDVWG